MDINKMIIRSGDLALWDGFRYSVPVKVLSIAGTGELNGTTQIRVRVTAERGPWKRGEVLDADGTEVYTRVRSGNGKYRNPAAIVPDGAMCPKHNRAWEDWANFGPHRPLPDGITNEVAQGQRDMIAGFCMNRRNCGV
jgi:hypothetical protein